MAESRRSRGGSGPGWLATLLGGGVLVVLGFGLGLVAGAAYQEPKLVAEHLAGRTVDVPLPSYEEAEDARPPAAPPATASAGPAEPPAPEAPATETPPPGTATPPASATASTPAAPTRRPALGEGEGVAATPPVASPGPRAEGFRIQVGAFGEVQGARKLQGELRAAGFPTEIEEVGSGARFKVRVGPLGTRSEAESLARKLEARKLPTWILAPGRG